MSHESTRVLETREHVFTLEPRVPLEDRVDRVPHREHPEDMVHGEAPTADDTPESWVATRKRLYRVPPMVCDPVRSGTLTVNQRRPAAPVGAGLAFGPAQMLKAMV